MLEIFEKGTKKLEFKEYKYYSIENSYQKLLSHEINYSGYIPILGYKKGGILDIKITESFPYTTLVFMYKCEEALAKVIPLVVMAQIGLQQHSSPLPIINDTSRQEVSYHSLGYHAQSYQGVCECVRFNPHIGIYLEMHDGVVYIRVDESSRKQFINILNDLKHEEVICLGALLSDNSNGIILPPLNDNNTPFVHYFNPLNYTSNLSNIYSVNFLSLSLKNNNKYHHYDDSNWITTLKYNNKSICKLFHGGIYIHLSLDDYDALVHHFKVHSVIHSFTIPIKTTENHYKADLNYDINEIVFKEYCSNLELMPCHFISPVDGISYYHHILLRVVKRYEIFESSPTVRLVWLFGVLVCKNSNTIDNVANYNQQQIKYLTRYVINSSREIIKGLSRENKIYNLCAQGYTIIATRITDNNYDDLTCNIDNELTLVFYSNERIIGYENFYSESIRNSVKQLKKFLCETNETAIDMVFEVSKIV